MDAGQGRAIRTEMTATEPVCADAIYVSGECVIDGGGGGFAAGSGGVCAGGCWRGVRSAAITRIAWMRILGRLRCRTSRDILLWSFVKAFASYGTYGPEAGDRRSRDGGLCCGLRRAQGEVIEARVGTSFLSVEQARKPILREEIPRWDFEQVQRETGCAVECKAGRGERGGRYR